METIREQLQIFISAARRRSEAVRNVGPQAVELLELGLGHRQHRGVARVLGARGRNNFSAPLESPTR